MANENYSEAIDSLNANLMQIGANLQNQKNYEDQKKYQKDMLRSQMLFQSAQYAQAQRDNSIQALAEQYREAGFNPRDALSRQGGANPMSAPSGMSAPQAPSIDLNSVTADMQRRHDSRLDDVERALSASKILSDEKQRNVLENQAFKILSDVINDKESLKLADANQQIQIMKILGDAQLKREAMQKRYDHLEKMYKETHRHNVRTEMNVLENSLMNLDTILDLVQDSLGFEDDSFLGRVNAGLKKARKRQLDQHEMK